MEPEEKPSEITPKSVIQTGLMCSEEEAEMAVDALELYMRRKGVTIVFTADGLKFN